MKLAQTGLEGVVEITPTRHGDARGYFAEVFRRDWFHQNIGAFDFVQQNQSRSAVAGTVRGLHFQAEPFTQGKLVSCTAGAIFDVAVDIRQGSSQYRQWTAVILSAENGKQLWIPPGFLHGFCTLTPDCVVSYQVTNYYDAASDRGVSWADPEIAIEWPEQANAALLSAKDTKQPLLRDLPPFFIMENV